MQQIIAVSATALTSGGGLTILQQFVRHIDDVHQYYVFVTNGISLPACFKPNVHFVSMPPKSFLQRIWWDFRGLKQWCKQKNIRPNVILSLQNTSIAYRHTKQIIYLHQGVPLHPKQWSFLRKNERALAIYKYIYPLFIFIHTNQQTQFVVQTEWMKKGLCERFGRCKQRVHVIKPEVEQIDISSVQPVSLNESTVLFYPANNAVYKNHQELINALYALKQAAYDMSSIGLYLTIQPTNDLQQTIQQLGLEKNIHFLGTLNTQEMQMYYKSCTMLVFPSYIESFGLPLLEAAMFGKPIVVTNAEYAKDVLQDYPHAYFATIHSPESWKEAILQALNHQSDATPSSIQYDSGWSDLFKIISDSNG